MTPSAALAAAEALTLLSRERQSHSRTIEARDRAHEAADRLAYALYGIEDIGEHTSSNDPWANAAELLEAAALAATGAAPERDAATTFEQLVERLRAASHKLAITAGQVQDEASILALAECSATLRTCADDLQSTLRPAARAAPPAPEALRVCETCAHWRQNAMQNGDCAAPGWTAHEFFFHNYPLGSSQSFDDKHVLVTAENFGCNFWEATL